MASNALAGNAATTAVTSLHPQPKTSILSIPRTFSFPKPNRRVEPCSSFRTQATVEDRLTGSKKESLYELLGIPEEGSFDDIKRAYKQKALIYHPDVCPTDRTAEYTRRFIEVQEAYETLIDPRTRAMYDRDLARGLTFAFSPGTRKRSAEAGPDEKSGWKSKWQNQVVELKNRSMHKDSEENMSWGARMRRSRAECSSV